MSKRIDVVKTKGASCPNCKCPLGALDFFYLAEQTAEHGDSYRVHSCDICGYEMTVYATVETSITITVGEVTNG